MHLTSLLLHLSSLEELLAHAAVWRMQFSTQPPVCRSRPSCCSERPLWLRGGTSQFGSQAVQPGSGILAADGRNPVRVCAGAGRAGRHAWVEQGMCAAAEVQQDGRHTQRRRRPAGLGAAGAGAGLEQHSGAVKAGKAHRQQRAVPSAEWWPSQALQLSHLPSWLSGSTAHLARCRLADAAIWQSAVPCQPRSSAQRGWGLQRWAGVGQGQRAAGAGGCRWEWPMHHGRCQAAGRSLRRRDAV